MKSILAIVVIFLLACTSATTFAYVIDHNSTDLGSIPESAIIQAKNTLHIAYGHTSHGSQLITGMNGLDGQTNLAGYRGDIYQWNEGGSGGALDIDDYFVGGDLGHNGSTAWANSTRTYLDNPANSDVNVVIWSWCGGCSDNTPAGIQIYLDAMDQLETDYPNVTFVYMTGHADGTSESGNLHLRNQQIRNYCIANNKVLYDFYDIELYDPDGNYFGDKLVNDECDYDSDANGSRDANWATEWQDSHTENVDWYQCSSAHSEPLNANRKAYAAWWLWARIAGWSGSSGGGDSEAPTVPQNLVATVMTPTQIDLSWDASSDNTAVTGYKIYRNGTEVANTVDNTYQDSGLSASATYTYRVSAYDAAGNESQLSDGAGDRWIPELIAPGDGAIDVPTNPNVYFQWVDDAARMNVTYTLYYSTDSNLGALILPPGNGTQPPWNGTIPVAAILFVLSLLLLWAAPKTGIRYRYAFLTLGAALILTACGGSGGGGSSSGGSSHSPTVYSVDKGTSDHHEASNLHTRTTYFWRVIATDTTDSSITYTSDTHEFTTAN